MWRYAPIKSTDSPYIMQLLSLHLQLSLLRLGFTALVCYCLVRGLYEVFGGKGDFNRSGQTGSSLPLRCIRRSAHRAGEEGSFAKLVSGQIRDLVALQ
jgi:hypothetical protein